MSVAVVFPGQGSQFVGMGKDFYEKFDSVKEFYSKADNALGYSLSEIMFAGPENDLKLTQNTQPALVTMSASIWSLIKDKVQPSFFAGHSLGEYSAVYAAGGLSFEETVKSSSVKLSTPISLSGHTRRSVWNSGINILSLRYILPLEPEPSNEFVI